MSEVIVDRHLGSFRRTGIWRRPRKGEYYMCRIVKGIGLRITDDGLPSPREILFQIRDTAK